MDSIYYSYFYTVAEGPVSLCLDDPLSSDHYECTTMRNDGELCQVSDACEKDHDTAAWLTADYVRPGNQCR